MNAAAVPRERGFALLIVLWTVVLLTLLATQLTASGRSEVLLAGNIRAAASVQAAADGAFQQAVFHALDTSERHWPADGAAHSLRLGSVVAEVRIDNEAGKINLNSAPGELVAALLHAVGTDTAASARLAAAILDWRFIDAQRVGGAKAQAYRDAGRAYGPPQAPFQSLDELGLVLGMTPDLLARVTPHLTIFHDGEPDYRVADPVVRRAMGEAVGGAPIPPTGLPEESVVAITVRAAAADGAAFVRRAVVRLGVGRDGRLFEVLTWGTA